MGDAKALPLIFLKIILHPKDESSQVSLEKQTVSLNIGAI